MDWLGTAWFWAGLALALFAAEAVVPGAFLLWLGFAATVLVPIVLILPGMGGTGQAIVFAIFAMISVGIGWRLRRQRSEHSANPLLNRRAAQFIGRIVPLTQAIEHGRGQVQVDDAFWVVEGPDLPLGASVRIVAAETMVLRVVPAG